LKRRWHLIGFLLLSLLALACEGTGNAGSSPTDRPVRGLPSSMAAMGDSITAGFGSCFALVACTRNSWSTGSSASVDSHYVRIRAGNPAIRGHADDFAVPGADAAALLRQAARVVDAKPAYVTVMIGANDACAPTVAGMTPVATFRKQVGAALTVVRKGLPKARVLVVSIPDLYRLWQVGHVDEHAVRAWRLGVCPSLLADPTSTAAADERRRQQVADRVEAYDDQLAAACRAYGKRCRWDGGAAHGVRFSLGLLNRVDYFHPDAQGQAKLADVTYPGKVDW
jgi:lysophospholipase L1-like esterase